MARRTRKPARDPHFWIQVRTVLRCHLGDHDVQSGWWVRMRRYDMRRLVSCEGCLKASGITRPNRSFTFRGDDSVDVRSRQSGEEDE